jgi:hypothetical protein
MSEVVENKCWCGVKNPYYAPLPNHCDGCGTITCYCGGDMCVCHWHGEVECFGCAECRDREDDYGN